MREVGVALDDSNGARQAPRVAEEADDDVSRLAKLTPGQLDCLRLVDEHLSSKEIAAELNISPHTVDQRIRQTLAILGVQRRTQAARMVARYFGHETDQYQRLIHQSPYIPVEEQTNQQQAAVSLEIRHADRAGEIGEAGFITEQRPASSWSSLQPPFATRNNPRNEMSVGQRLFWIVAIAMGAAFSAGMYLAGLESLARLFKH